MGTERALGKGGSKVPQTLAESDNMARSAA